MYDVDIIDVMPVTDGQVAKYCIHGTVNGYGYRLTLDAKDVDNKPDKAKKQNVIRKALRDEHLRCNPQLKQGVTVPDVLGAGTIAND